MLKVWARNAIGLDLRTPDSQVKIERLKIKLLGLQIYNDLGGNI